MVSALFTIHAGIPNPANAILRIALISVTSVLVMLSVLMFITGFICGHYAGKKSVDKNDGSTSANEHEEDLEMKGNVAYITLRPK